LIIIAAEVLIDGMVEVGVTGVSAIAIGAVGWVQFRRIWRSEITQVSGSKELCEAPLIAAPPGSGAWHQSIRTVTVRIPTPYLWMRPEKIFFLSLCSISFRGASDRL
jgi:hypothetical protein